MSSHTQFSKMFSLLNKDGFEGATLWQDLEVTKRKLVCMIYSCTEAYSAQTQYVGQPLLQIKLFRVTFNLEIDLHYTNFKTWKRYFIDQLIDFLTFS